jgi:ATP-binding cassette subfamily F protein 3
MDEPTNHLDLASKEVLEEALAGFTGTIVFISHDRYFINRIATQVVEVDRGRLTTHLGTYDDYLDHKAQAATTPPPAETTETTRSTAPKPKPADQASARRISRVSASGGSAGAISGPPQMKSLKNETEDTTHSKTADRRKSTKNLDREIKAIKVRLGAVETQIHEMEARLQEIGLALADPDLYRDGDRARDIAQARRDTEERVAWLMKEWEELSLRLSAVSGEAR